MDLHKCRIWVFGLSQTLCSSNPSNLLFVVTRVSGTPTNEIFALLDTVQSDNENEIHELMNDSDTKFTDPAYQQSRQCECFDTKGKFSRCWRSDHTH